MQHPFQCLLALPSSLIAACGPRLLSLDLTNGEIVSEWTADDNSQKPSDAQGNDDNNGDERPAKKQKISKPAPQASNVIKLTASPNFQHVVAVTDDKLIRVFEAQTDGKLTELSQRSMPKRPCAIEVMPDNATILCGDKFGDVYSLPLLSSGEEDAAAGAVEPPKQTMVEFKPSATDLTVHSRRNRLALEAQQKQKHFTPKKEALSFPHKLLLGHVSMLTDMAFATRTVDGKDRGYIITADRDEHIRISRGPPQAHIIEGYCLGHTDFISKMCLIPGIDHLVSGGGDNWLGVWKWPESKLVTKIDLLELLRSNAIPEVMEEGYKLAVSGLWTMQAPTGDSAEQVLLLTCEKVKALVLVKCSALGVSGSTATVMKLPGHPIDAVEAGSQLVVSLDARETGAKRLHVFDISKSSDGSLDSDLSALPQEGNAKQDGVNISVLNQTTGPEASDKQLDDLLYNTANLRKRGNKNDGEASAAAVEAEEE